MSDEGSEYKPSGQTCAVLGLDAEGRPIRRRVRRSTRTSTSFSAKEIAMLDEVFRALLRGGETPEGVKRSPALPGLAARIAKLKARTVKP